MKALSIKQPWASLIAHGIKDIENRTWRTNFRGKIYIHVSVTKKFNISMNDEQTKLAFPVLQTAFDGVMSFAAIIGEVEIIDCVINHSSIWAEKTPFARSGNQIFYPDKPIWNWVLANPVLYDKPILNIKGKLSFWVPDPNQECMICGERYFGHDPVFCCKSPDCGCLGMAAEPLVCSKECYDNFIVK